MHIPHSGIQGKKVNSKVSMYAKITYGKVVNRNSDNTVDVAAFDGGTYPHVQVGSNVLGSQVGNVYLPAHDLTNPASDPGGTWDTPTASGKGDLYALMAFIGRRPIVICFFNPDQSEMVFNTLGIKVDRHESGTYHVTLPSGHDEQQWSDGSYFVFGDTTPHDMQSENPNWSVTPQGGPAPVVFHHASGLTISVTSAGGLTISAVNDIAVSTDANHAVTISGKSVTLQGQNSSYTVS